MQAIKIAPLFRHALGLLLLLTLAFAQAASFDCTKARGQDERAICADRSLSKMDDELAVQYKEVLSLIGTSGPRLTAFRAVKMPSM
jgi:uncharacterized protein